jgi:6-pyruvoyl-tetrahydropterin synthase related domain
MRHVPSLLACLGVHLALTLYFAPPSVVLSDSPISGGDYSTHAEQTVRVVEGLRGWGRPWVYDVQLHAGYPNGTVFDADNKAWELWSYALHRMGLPVGRAFNLFTWLVFMLLPLPLWAAARVLGLTPGASVLAVAMGTLLLFFDGLLHWLGYVGTLAFVFAAYLCPLSLAMFHRYLLARDTRDVVWLTLLLGWIHLVHPYAFFVLGPPMLLSCFLLRATLTRAELGKLAAMGLAVIAMNAFWLVPALRHFHYVLDSSYLMSADVRQIGLDFFGLLSDVSTTGVIANHTAFRLLAFALCAGCLWLARSDASFGATRVLRHAWLWVLALAYLGDHLPLLPQIQPYRFMVPAMFLAVFPAADLLARAPQLLPWSTLAAPARALVVVVLLALSQHLAAQVLYFFPDALPKVRWFLDSAPSPVTATGFAPHPTYRLKPEPSTHKPLVRFLQAHRHEGRVAIQDAALGEDMLARTHASILGGFPFCNLAHSYANPFRTLLEGTMTPSDLRKHVEAYAIRYVVLSHPEPLVDQAHALFEEVTTIGPHRILRTRHAVSLLAQGTGQLAAQTNRIAITGSDPNTDLVLRFHWHKALRCTQGCKQPLEQADNPVGRVPFIRVPAPHAAEVVIENRYGM